MMQNDLQNEPKFGLDQTPNYIWPCVQDNIMLEHSYD